jgi:membrane protein implicated in regulation of membrane protease activity
MNWRTLKRLARIKSRGLALKGEAKMGLYLLIPTLLVIIGSVLIVRAGAIALRMTGLDEKTAAFQALSAFTRAGFTTKESEMVVSHSQRRTIITWLIILGNAGILAAIVTATSSLATSTDYKLAIAIAVLIAGIFLIYIVARFSGLNRWWERFVEKHILRGRVFSAVPRIEHLVHFLDGYGVGRISIHDKSSADESSLAGKLTKGDFTVLGIERRDQWIPNPGAGETIKDGDYVVLYGELSKMDAIIRR